MIYGSLCSGIEIGGIFGRLVITDIYSPKRSDQFRLRCRCECGAEVDCVASELTHGKKRSCGCYRRDRMGGMFRSHGKSKTPEYCMFYDARKRAQKFGLPFTITPNDIDIPADCPVLGISLSHNGARDYRPSLDRIIPTLGYTPANIRVISFRANRIKSDASLAELRAVVAYIEEAAP